MNPFERHVKPIGYFTAFLFLICLTGIAKAQTPVGTRATPCDPATPNDAICLTWTMAPTNTDGSPTVLPQTYRVEQKTNADGLWKTIATGLTVTQLYVKKLAPDTYTYRVYENCVGTGCSESGASNTGSRAATAPAVIPNPPALQVVQVTISADHAPVYRVVGSVDRYTRGEMYGLVAVGRACSGPALFRYRGKSFYLVQVKPDELWGTLDGSRLAAPCG